MSMGNFGVLIMELKTLLASERLGDLKSFRAFGASEDLDSLLTFVFPEIWDGFFVVDFLG